MMIKKILKILLSIILVFILLIAVVLVFSVRPVDRTFYKETEYYKNTVTSLQEFKQNSPAQTAFPLFVGVGRAGLTPPIGVPLAGFGARKGAPSTGVHDSLFIRVIGLKSGPVSAYIIGYDALLLHPPIARMVEEKAQNELGINADQLYFTATHSHSGPGGWGNSFVEEQFSGPSNPDVYPFFIDSTVAALKRAQDDFQISKVKRLSQKAPGFIRNRLVGEKGLVDDELFTLAFSREGKIDATFTTYSAHATTLSGRNMLYSGDYPGYFERKLESFTKGTALFAAAGLGSHSYRSKGKDFEKSEYVGEGLADSVINGLEAGDYNSDVVLKTLRIPIEIPSHQVRMTNNVRLAPWLARKIFKANDAFVQILAIDNNILFGSPAEFSGELALQLKEFAVQQNINVSVTSFNGCYLGYVTPSKYYNMNSYETRLMSWFGPYTGDYLVDLMKMLIG
jgi:neutral ceramidase